MSTPARPSETGSATPGRATTQPAPRGVRGPFAAVALGVIVLVAVGLSFFASASPDGLEWTAEHLGFADAAADSAVAGGPLADYGLAGWDAFWSNAVAGLVGVLVVLAVTFGLTRLLGRRA
ncbi:PDGLE domain-containing protein [Propioniciclava soli]|uniref:PDGLE domain-containing protein n=1 Tax=Propioniciclava soli TaxID=2775081 RepID=A0ABZ3C805_9ACTN